MRLGGLLIFMAALLVGWLTGAHAGGRGPDSYTSSVYESLGEQKPNTMSVELGGRGLLYSLNYDRAIEDQVSLGIGISGFSLYDSLSSNNALIVPVYANIYFSPGVHRPFLTGGVDLAYVSESRQPVNASEVTNYFETTSTAAVLGAGYEYRGNSGFLFRGAPYVLVGHKVAVWAGISAGAAF